MNWQKMALDRIAAVHSGMPAATAEDLRKELRRHSSAFSSGTSWGRKVWPKVCREYMAQRFGIASGRPRKRVEDSPLFKGRDDITFPYRETGRG